MGQGELRILLPERAQDLLVELSAVLCEHGLRLDSVGIKLDRPRETKFTLATPGGLVRVTREV